MFDRTLNHGIRFLEWRITCIFDAHYDKIIIFINRDHIKDSHGKMEKDSCFPLDHPL